MIEEFYEKEGYKYNITLEECKLICSSPFRFVKEILSRGILRNIRFQYFGVFEVSKARIKYDLIQLEESYSKGNISQKRYEEKKKVLTQELV